MKKKFCCFMERVSSSPALYRIIIYPPKWDEVKKIPQINRRKPIIFINPGWYLEVENEVPKMYLADEVKNERHNEKTSLLYENHSSIPFWYNQDGKFYGEIKITGQIVRGTIVNSPDKNNPNGDFDLELFDGRFDDLDKNGHPDEDLGWQKAFEAKQKLITRLGLNNNLNLFTITEIKNGHLQIKYKPF